MRPLLVLAALAVCVTPAAAATIQIADSGTTATRLVADMEAIALRAQGHTVTRVAQPSARQAADALTAGSIDVYVADTAELVENVYGSVKRRRDAAMRDFVAARVAADGARAVAYSSADDAPAVACRPAVTRARRLTNLGRLPRVAPQLRYGATPAHMLRGDGYWTLRSTFRWVVVRRGSARFALIARKRLDCVESSRAEPRAARLHLVTLADRTRRLAGTPNRVVTVARVADVDATPAIQTTADLIAARLTRAALTGLRGQVEITRIPSVTVAGAFLVSIGVIPPT